MPSRDSFFSKTVGGVTKRRASKGLKSISGVTKGRTLKDSKGMRGI